MGVEVYGQEDACFTSCNTYGGSCAKNPVFGILTRLTKGLLPFAHTGVLKHALRSVHRMMQSSGTTEGLRGLIDSSLLASVKTIIQYRGLFGPTVLPIGILPDLCFVPFNLSQLHSDQYYGNLCTQRTYRIGYHSRSRAAGSILQGC